MLKLSHLDMKLKIFIHLINVAEDITNDSRNDSLESGISKNTLNTEWRTLDINRWYAEWKTK